MSSDILKELQELAHSGRGERTWNVKSVVKHYDSRHGVIVLPNRGGLYVPEGVKPLEVITVRHNLLVNAGIQRMLDLLLGAGGQAFDSATPHCRIGVGDDSTTATASQTDLQAAAGSTHRQFKLVDATYPSRSGQTVTTRSTFAAGEANFHWQEWGIDIGTADGTTVVTPLLNRKVADLGTKASPTVSQFTATITVS